MLTQTKIAAYRARDSKQWREIGWMKNTQGYMQTVRKNREGKRVCILEHVLVMEKKLGRALVNGENVHHINGIRTDNRIENLEIWNTHQPTGQRAEDMLQYAYKIIKLYGEAK